MNLKPKIVFMGTPEFGAIILEGLCKSGYKPVLVITASDKPTGRKQILTPPPVKLLAEKFDIPIFQPQEIKNQKSKIKNLNPELIIVAAYGQILPKEILEIPKYNCLNVHPSLLPKYRGPSPIQAAILNGDKETGITIIKMTEKVDAGPIISNTRHKIQDTKYTYRELLKELAELGAELLINTIPKWIKGEIKPGSQDESRAIYTKIVKKEDGKINWKKSAIDIERQIRALDPWPGTHTFYNNKILKILKAGILEQTKAGPSGRPGKTFLAPDDKIAVQTGKDFLLLQELQLEGAKPISSKDFLRGREKFIGTMLK